MREAFIIILALGGLEAILWVVSEKWSRKEMKEQTDLLESIAVTLSLKETKEADDQGKV